MKKKKRQSKQTRCTSCGKMVRWIKIANLGLKPYEFKTNKQHICVFPVEILDQSETPLFKS